MAEEKGANTSNGVHQSTQPLRALANPVPLGLFAFASTTFLLSMYNVRTRGIATGDLGVGMALFCGGLTQFIAGMWAFPHGNTLGATAMTSYGAFWMSYGTILIPGSGVAAAFGGDEKEFGNALGVFFVVWFMFTTMLIPAVAHKNLAFTILFSVLAITFIVLAAGEFLGKSSVIKGGGIIGIITALVAYYIAISELLGSDDKAYVKLPLGVW